MREMAAVINIWFELTNYQTLKSLRIKKFFIADKKEISISEKHLKQKWYYPWAFGHFINNQYKEKNKIFEIILDGKYKNDDYLILDEYDGSKLNFIEKWYNRILNILTLE